MSYHKTGKRIVTIPDALSEHVAVAGVLSYMSNDRLCRHMVYTHHVWQCVFQMHHWMGDTRHTLCMSMSAAAANILYNQS